MIAAHPSSYRTSNSSTRLVIRCNFFHLEFLRSTLIFARNHTAVVLILSIEEIKQLFLRVTLYRKRRAEMAGGMDLGEARRRGRRARKAIRSHPAALPPNNDGNRRGEEHHHSIFHFPWTSSPLGSTRVRICQALMKVISTF